MRYEKLCERLQQRPLHQRICTYGCVEIGLQATDGKDEICTLERLLHSWNSDISDVDAAELGMCFIDSRLSHWGAEEGLHRLSQPGFFL